MKLLSLSLRNYRQHRDTAITFAEGVTGILGANGSGKSSILEAIAYALYGPHAAKRDGSVEGILWQRAPGKSDVTVRLSFELSGETYTLERGLKQAKLFKGDGGGTAFKVGPKEVTQHVEERLGMDREAFFNSFFARQKELAFLATVKGAKRQELITKMLGLAQLDEARERVTVDRRALANVVKGKAQALGDLDAARARAAEAKATADAAEVAARAARDVATMARQGLDASRPAFEALQAKAKAAQQLAAEHGKAQVSLKAAEANQLRLDRELAQLRVAEADLVAVGADLTTFDPLTAEFEGQEKLRASAEQRSRLESTRDGLQKELAAREAEHAQVLSDRASLGDDPAPRQKAAQARLAELTRAISDQERTAAGQLAEVKTTLAAQQKRYKDLAAKRKHLESGEHDACPTCLRPLDGEALPAVFATFDAELAEIVAGGKALREQEKALAQDAPKLVADRADLAKVQAELQSLAGTTTKFAALNQRDTVLQRELSARRTELEKAVKALEALPQGYDAARHAALKAELARLAPAKKREVELKATLKRLPGLSAERDAAAKVLADAGTTLADLEARQKALAFDPQAAAAEEAAFREREAAERQAHTAAVKAEQEATGARDLAKVHAEAEQELVRRRRELDGDQRELEHLEALEEQLKALRDTLNGRIRPELAEQAGVYLAALTDGRYTAIEIDEAYDVRVQDGAEFFPVERFSGGEQDVVNLCLRLAISQMIADRAGQELSLVVLDEVFGALDEDRRDNVVQLLSALQARFAQVVLISHLEEIRGALDHAIRVRFDEPTGASVVVVDGDEAEEALPMLASTGIG